MPPTIRTATDDDLEVCAHLVRRAFSVTPGQAPRADRPTVDTDRRLVAELDGRIVGHLGAWPLGHFLGGRRIDTAGISAVAVAPEARGRGVGSALVRAGLDAARERGEPLSSLFPLTRHVYRRHGYELAGTFPEVELSVDALNGLPAPAGDVTVEPGAPDDLDEMLALEQRLATTEPGMLARRRTFARRSLEPGEHGAIALARRAGRLTGYVVYGHDTTTETGAFYRLDVHELVGEDADTLRALWRVLGSSASAARTATAVVAPEDPLELWLPERAWRTRTESWRWMLRLVDPVAAVAARGWPAQVRGSCHLDVVDPTWPDRGGPYVLEVAGGEAVLEPGGDGRVRTDVGALASWFTGWATATRLVRAGRVTDATDGDLAFLDAATAGPTPWLRTFF